MFNPERYWHDRLYVNAKCGLSSLAIFERWSLGKFECRIILILSSLINKRIVDHLFSAVAKVASGKKKKKSWNLK